MPSIPISALPALSSVRYALAYHRQARGKFLGRCVPFVASSTILGFAAYHFNTFTNSRFSYLSYPFVAVIAQEMYFRLRVRYFWDVYRFTKSHLRREVSFVRKEHADGLRVVEDSALRGTPFLLHLRSFEVEYQSVRFEKGKAGNGIGLMGDLVDDNPSNEAIIRFADGQNTRADLGSAVGDRMQVLSLGNATDPMLTLVSTKSLHLLEDNWSESIKYLIESSAVIVFEISSYTPGVISELEYIRFLRCESKTFVALSGPLDQRKRPNLALPWDADIDRFIPGVPPSDVEKAQKLLEGIPNKITRSGEPWEEILEDLGCYRFIDQLTLAETDE